MPNPGDRTPEEVLEEWREYQQTLEEEIETVPPRSETWINLAARSDLIAECIDSMEQALSEEGDDDAAE